MKKMLIWLLALIMLLTAMPAMADNVRTSGDFEYTVKGNGTATITKYNGKQQDIILPNLIDGYTITTIGEGAFALSTAPSYDREKISVTLPETITSIEANAFKNRYVYSINLPDALEYIGGGAFEGSTLDIQFRLSNNHPRYATIDGSLYNKAKKELIKWVYEPENLDAVPNGIVSIGDYAFAGIMKDCIKWFPTSVSSIGVGAFKNTDDLCLSFRSGCNIEEIPDWAFGNEDTGLVHGSIEIIRLPSGVETIGDYAFRHALLRPYESWDPAESGISFTEFLQSVRSIGDYAFDNCYFGDPIKIVIPSTCETIGEGAFFDVWSDITGISLADGIERIEDKAFQIKTSCQKFESVYLPESLTYIGYDAFNVGMAFVVESGSYAERWAKENAFPYTVNGEEQNLDWLYN